VSDIDTGVVDSVKALDPRRPIREADIVGAHSRRELFAKAAIAASLVASYPCVGVRSCRCP
jgi:hypothetical protein